MKLFSRNRPELPERRRTSVRQNIPEAPEVLYSGHTFRRGRTLTGSVSPHVRALSETQADLKSPRVHAHILAKKRRRLAGAFLLVVIAASSLFMLMSQFTAHAVLRATPDPSLKLQPAYAKSIEAYLGDHPVERFRPLINLTQLTAYVQDSAPEVKAIQIDGAAGFGKSLFVITLRKPVASWNVNGRQLFVDENGVPFSQNYFAAPLLHITDQSGISTAPGQTVASNRFIGFIGQIISLAKARGYTVTDIVIPPGMTRQVDVRLDGVGYPIKFSSDRPAGESVEDMVRAVKWMAEKQLTPEYVDVRVKGRAFYR